LDLRELQKISSGNIAEMCGAALRTISSDPDAAEAILQTVRRVRASKGAVVCESRPMFVTTTKPAESRGPQPVEEWREGIRRERASSAFVLSVYDGLGGGSLVKA
jgi:hypothetical protein